MQLVVIDKQVLQATLNYLARQPLGDVLQLFNAIGQALQKADPPEKKFEKSLEEREKAPE